ncbi:MAG: hypothetical protein CM1200mP2_06470 [Planctomycetaceae bacterium]|nr:MAG: hypothetical protein CM1200mP2_06470 [Planctomycetaceae bacterium]
MKVPGRRQSAARPNPSAGCPADRWAASRASPGRTPPSPPHLGWPACSEPVAWCPPERSRGIVGTTAPGDEHVATAYANRLRNLRCNRRKPSRNGSPKLLVRENGIGPRPPLSTVVRTVRPVSIVIGRFPGHRTSCRQRPQRPDPISTPGRATSTVRPSSQPSRSPTYHSRSAAKMLRLTSRTAWLLVLFLAIAVAAPAANVLRLSTAVVPGTGLKIEEMGDDFEASDWKWYPNGPKASRNLDRRERLPGGSQRERAVVREHLPRST